MERLINEVHMLGLNKASLEERGAATARTIQAIQDACSLSSRPCVQVTTTHRLQIMLICQGYPHMSGTVHIKAAGTIIKIQAQLCHELLQCQKLD